MNIVLKTSHLTSLDFIGNCRDTRNFLIFGLETKCMSVVDEISDAQMMGTQKKVSAKTKGGAGSIKAN